MKKELTARKYSWIALTVGFLAFVFSSGRWNIPLTAWIWPAAFLYYSRSAGNVRQYLPLAAAVAAGNIIRWLNVLDSGYIVDGALCLVWSVCWILPYIADRLLYKRLPGWLSTLLLPAAFASSEVLRQFGIFGSSGSTAYTQTGFLPLIQSVSLVGCFGLSFLIIWFAPVLLYACKKGNKWQGILAIYLVIVSAFLVFGTVRLHAAPESVDTVRAASIVGPYYRAFGDGEYDVISYDESVSYLTSEAERAADGGAKVACWNEEAFCIDVAKENDFLDVAAKLSESYGMTLFLAYETYHSENTGDELEYNKLMIIQPDGTRLEYIKTHLVPVMEAPYYVKGDGEIPTVGTENGVFSGIICFDDSYISFNHGFGAKTSGLFENTDILFVPSWDWSSVAVTHTKCSEFRAVENGYALVKPTYDGLSAAVDRYGRELFLSDTNENGYDSVAVIDVPVAGRQTFYGRYGNILDSVFGCSGVLLVLFGAVISMKKRNTELYE